MYLRTSAEREPQHRRSVLSYFISSAFPRSGRSYFIYYYQTIIDLSVRTFHLLNCDIKIHLKLRITTQRREQQVPTVDSTMTSHSSQSYLRAAASTAGRGAEEAYGGFDSVTGISGFFGGYDGTFYDRHLLPIKNKDSGAGGDSSEGTDGSDYDSTITVLIIIFMFICFIV